MNIKSIIKTLILFLILTLISYLMTTKTLVAHGATDVKWNYQGKNNPQNWGQFSSTCAIGKKQSPIDVNLTNKQLTKVYFNYQLSSMHILNNGRTVMVKCDRASYIMLDNKRYEIQQFHYHSPSEHSLNGQFFPAELHLVHQQKKQYTVIGIVVKEGTENLAYQPFIDRLPPQESPEIDLGITINLAKLLPNNKTAYRYSGSLTTPPCTEGVNWLLMTDPVELSPAQITALKNVFNGNNRPIQRKN
jgi:carbonic anhydrase